MSLNFSSSFQTNHDESDDYKGVLRTDIEDTMRDNAWLQKEVVHVRAQNETLRAILLRYHAFHQQQRYRDLQYADHVASTASRYHRPSTHIPGASGSHVVQPSSGYYHARNNDRPAKPSYKDKRKDKKKRHSSSSSSSSSSRSKSSRTMTPPPVRPEPVIAAPRETKPLPPPVVVPPPAPQPPPPAPVPAPAPAPAPIVQPPTPASPPSLPQSPQSPQPGAPVVDDFAVGDLYITIHGAKDLPNVDTGITRMFGDKSDPYVRLLIDRKKGPQTKVINNNLNPQWEETFKLPLSGYLREVQFIVNDKDMVSAKDCMGAVTVLIPDIIKASARTETFITRRSYKITNQTNKGELILSLRWIPSEIATRDEEVPNAPFKLHRSCNVRLYQDAHSGNKLCPVPCGTGQGGAYQRHHAFDDMYELINGAQHFLYMTGWSVCTSISLKRTGQNDIKLGDLLKAKAEQGVKVFLLLWNDITSVDNVLVNAVSGLTKAGLMSTFDEDTKKFFKKTKVEVQLVPRDGSGVQSHGNMGFMSKALSGSAANAVFTHHQKTIIADAPSAITGRRRVIAFVGGLDVTKGRYDDPSFPLFSSLKTTHAEDYYQGCGPTFDSAHGPRQPWHDIHGRVEGGIAWDVMRNFEQRWHKQVSKHLHKLVDMSKLPLLKEDEDEQMLGQHLGPNKWHVQLLRSIDSYSALRSDKGSKEDWIDRSIQDAYIHHIRRAERYIYIENQYFLGSAMEWLGFDDRTFNVEAKHLVPLELVNKVVSKIRKHERFAVYIVIPMHPEGVADSAPIQGILFWQYKTIEMMYTKIGQAIAKYGPHGASVKDYLNIYFPGQREPGPPINIAALKDDRQKRVCASRRHMIYVHSKMMICDDELIIVGSANINERSMAGDRDTEIAFAASQPNHTQRVSGKRADGEIAGFRLSLWSAFLGCFNPLFLTPESIECVKLVNSLAENNWLTYTSPEVMALPHGYLMPYPYSVDMSGTMFPRVECFPDHELTKGTVKGVQCGAHMTLLTT